MFGFHRIAMCVPEVKVANTAFNAEQIFHLAEKAAAENASAIVFPELAVTGSTCGDLFFQSVLLDAAEAEVRNLCSRFSAIPGVIFLGAPVRFNGALYNTCIVIRAGRIAGIVPKINLQNGRGAYEKRCFVSAAGLINCTADFAGQKNIPFGTDLLFTAGPELIFGVEVGEDLWSVIPPSSRLAPAGANVIINPAAGEEIIGKARYRCELVRGQSARCIAAYVSASAGVGESTTDSVCSGHCLCAENGRLLIDSRRFRREGTIDFADIDLQRMAGARLSDSFYANSEGLDRLPFRRIDLKPVPGIDNYRTPVCRLPFVPTEKKELAERCREVFAIQTAGLAKRIEHVHAKKLVIGISGGLDSTLALLVCARTMNMLGRPENDVIAVTMPGFGTTGRTYNNACALCRLLGAELREISILKACMQHFEDISHDPELKNVVYENTQARERTQILLDIANAEAALAVGTGDLSEGAMGWCTYNGDHISMYGVNCSVPKTLLRHVIANEGEKIGGNIRKILQDIIDTPVSPELLPAGKDGEIKQKTEDIIGPYEVHDFFLYHFFKYGAEPAKILYLAGLAFPEFPKEKLALFLGTFIRRFFTQQFKRSCSPDGPKVGTIALSPRGDLRMPSDAVFDLWTKEIGR